MKDSQLRWSQQNCTAARKSRAGRDREPVSIGGLARAALAHGEKTSALQRRLWIVLGEEGEEGLLRHVEALELRKGVLTLHIDEPDAVYALRLCWEQRVLDRVQAQMPDIGVYKVRFMAAVQP